jgi:hypothetical protein
VPRTSNAARTGGGAAVSAWTSRRCEYSRNRHTGQAVLALGRDLKAFRSPGSMAFAAAFDWSGPVVLVAAVGDGR